MLLSESSGRLLQSSLKNMYKEKGMDLGDNLSSKPWQTKGKGTLHHERNIERKRNRLN